MNGILDFYGTYRELCVVVDDGDAVVKTEAAKYRRFERNHDAAIKRGDDKDTGYWTNALDKLVNDLASRLTVDLGDLGRLVCDYHEGRGRNSPGQCIGATRYIRIPEIDFAGIACEPIAN